MNILQSDLATLRPDRRTWEPYLQQRPAYADLHLWSICGALGGELGPDAAPPGPALHWLPRAADIARMVRVAELVHQGAGLPTLVEVGAGSGLLSYLLARTGRLQVTAVEPDAALLTGHGLSHLEGGLLRPDARPGAPYAHPNLRLLPATARAAAELLAGTPPDVVLCSWMPNRFNLAADIRRLHPAAIIYTRRDFVGTLESDLPEHLAYERRFTPRRPYQRRLTWATPSEGDVMDLLRALTGASEEPVVALFDNLVEVQVAGRAAAAVTAVAVDAGPALPPYPWEAEGVTELVRALLPAEVALRLLYEPQFAPDRAALADAIAVLMEAPPPTEH